jgi:hypothetical protein
VFSAIFKAEKCRKSSVFGAVSEYFGRLGAYFPPLNPSTTIPCLGNLPANSQCTN